MAGTELMNKNKYKKPIIMDSNPARAFMTKAEARIDDLAAIDRQIEIEALEDKLKGQTKQKIQAHRDKAVDDKKDKSDAEKRLEDAKAKRQVNPSLPPKEAAEEPKAAAPKPAPSGSTAPKKDNPFKKK